MVMGTDCDGSWIAYPARISTLPVVVLEGGSGGLVLDSVITGGTGVVLALDAAEAKKKQNTNTHGWDRQQHKNDLRTIAKSTSKSKPRDERVVCEALSFRGGEIIIIITKHSNLNKA